MREKKEGGLLGRVGGASALVLARYARRPLASSIPNYRTGITRRQLTRLPVRVFFCFALFA
jgi:hypothetical protein